MAPGVYRSPGGQGDGQCHALGPTRWDRKFADWVYLGIDDLDVPWPQGCTVALGVKVKVKVKMTSWDQRGGSENLRTRCSLGLVT